MIANQTKINRLTTTSTELTWLLSREVFNSENSCCNVMGCPTVKLLPAGSVEDKPTTDVLALFAAGRAGREKKEYMRIL